MKILAINDFNNTNFKAKLKPNGLTNKKISNEFLAPVLMASLTAQFLKDQALNSTIDNSLSVGYLKNKPTEDEVKRGKKLANCFKFFRDQEQDQILFDIMMIMTGLNRNINDVLFVKKFFEFVQGDMPTKAKVEAFEILSKKDNSKLIETTTTNYSTFTEDLNEIIPRFDIEDLMILENIYNTSSNKDLILDMVREGINIDDSELKTYRFNLNDITILPECYENTPYKKLFNTLISQYEYNEFVEEDLPLYNSNMILHIINTCFLKEKADFLNDICSQKIITNNKKVNRFKGETIFIFNNIYDKYPKELIFLINQIKKDKNGNKVPRFNDSEIIELMKLYDNIGSTVIKLVKETEEEYSLDTQTLLFLLKQINLKQNAIQKKKN